MRENTPVKVALELKYGENKSGDIQEQGFLGKGNSQCKGPEEWNKNRASEAREW